MKAIKMILITLALPFMVVGMCIYAMYSVVNDIYQLIFEDKKL